MTLVKKEEFFGFHKPVKTHNRNFQVHGSISMGRGVNRFYFSRQLQKDIADLDVEIKRAAFKFEEGEAFVVVNPPKEKGIPFYKVNSSSRTINNFDLVAHMAESLGLDKSVMAVKKDKLKDGKPVIHPFYLEKHSKFGNMVIYKINLKKKVD